MNNKISKIKKLEDISLEKVSSGLSDSLATALFAGGGFGMLAGFIGSPACAISSAVYSSKSHKAIQNGDTKKAKKYAKTAKDLTIATSVLSCLAPIGMASALPGFIHLNNQK